ncbi:MAG: imidazoleglycerol-phosphate dehydratase HisB [Deltaproteobacteria bacterium]|jgi:imidazoleglycerol-phosphate dehydratase|nr:imidazoleglycerol-phosphate dehydratase HisB [Deltaproteobacteria bacterium]
MGRTATIERRTSETDIKVVLDLDGSGQYQVETPIGFLTHMVEQLAKHGLFDLKVTAKGDTHIDGHHTTEDLAIALGQAFAAALGDKVGIRRYGFATLPMDEARVTCALDLSGRPFFVWAMELPKAKIGDFDSELAEVFFEGFARGSQCNLHMRQEAGDNLHHVIEISFKAFARSLRQATEEDPRVVGVPSTKGTLSE